MSNTSLQSSEGEGAGASVPAPFTSMQRNEKPRRTMPRCDKRGPVAVVEQWAFEHGPTVTFLQGHPNDKTPAERMAWALRAAASRMARAGCVMGGGTAEVWVCVRGRWMTA